MIQDVLSVRELQKEDIELIAEYWSNADTCHVQSMGCDETKIPKKEEFKTSLNTQLNLPVKEKESYAIIWLLNEKPIGHCNVNTITYGKEAYMHLHIWNSNFRKKGIGVELVKKSLPYFFKNLKLSVIYCEPFTENKAPNKTVEKVGFEFVKEYETVPGAICLNQSVNRWKLTRQKAEYLHLIK